MKLALLGHSGVGKTTYIATVYGLMQAKKKMGLGLSAENRLDHKALMDAFRAIRHGHYPPPTAVRSQYHFSLTHAGERILSFLWADYRGGDLRDSTDSPGASALRQDLSQCDGIIVFADGSLAARSGERSRARVQLGRIAQLMAGGMPRRNTRRLPIALVLTKADLAENPGEVAVDLFDGLREVIARSDHLIGTIVAASCAPKTTGRGSVFSWLARLWGRRHETFGVNVELPLLFLLRFGLDDLIEDLAFQQCHQQETAEHYRNQVDRRWFRNWLAEIAFVTSDAMRAQQAQENAENLLLQLQPLVPSADAMGGRLKGLPLFGATK